MNMREKNLQAISRGFPELYEKIKQNPAGENTDQIVEVDNMETNSELGALCVKTCDGNIFRMNSPYDPVHEAGVWMEGQDISDQANLFMFGLGNGAFARALLGKKNLDNKILIYEPSKKIFDYALDHYDLTCFFEQRGVRVIVEGYNEEMYSGVMEEMLTIENSQSRCFLTCPYYGEIFPKSLRFFVDYYMDGVGRLYSNKNTTRRFIHLSPYNQLHNMQGLGDCTTVPNLRRVWDPEVPVLLLGAGPSLKEEIDTIKEGRDRAYVFAVDSALPFLMSQDIIPDAFILVEADKPLGFFEDERVKDIPIFTLLNASHKVLDQQRGPKIFGYDNGLPDLMYGEYKVEKSTYRYGGNGATSFFAICQDLGAKNLALVGQDMAYSKD
ncbi:MAG: DUF115 domain-containing protein, partial [Eubacterium sp.]|nr:DUF115 domain-containing protein [Eubacterium sp.]